MTDHKCTIPSGRALGGTSTINSMVYTRGNPLDYDIWADLGNKGWCWSDVLPFFKKIEDANFEPFDKKLHHRGGLQHLQHPQHLTHLSEHILESAKELDIEAVDYNGKHQLGASIPQLSTDCGQRFSASSAYLECAEKRKNLVIQPLAQVLKILISTHTKEVKGVQYLHDGKVFVAKAKKEVILAAGAINTAKILLLSGIGPKDECEKHSIDLVKDLHVGLNLNVRPTFLGLDFLYKEHEVPHKSEHELYEEYLKHGKGPLTSPGVEGLLFLNTGVSKEHPEYPDIELQVVSKSHPKIEDYNWMKISKVHYDSIWKPLEDHHYVKMLVTLNHPASKGVLKLHTTNPLDYPIIEPHFLTDEDEVDYHTLLAGIHKAIKLSHTKAFGKTGLIINHHPIHGCDSIEFGTDSYWECAVKYLVVPTEDVSGTARMGPATDHEAVVDNQLKVHGIHKLRVADASILPVSITGNLMGVSMMIGEKAAHMIIEDWTTDH